MRLLSRLQAASLLLSAGAIAQSSSASGQASQTSTSYRPEFTVPDFVNYGVNIQPNIYDPKAVNAQTVCPGYLASSVKTSSTSITAHLTLAGTACNVYGTDIHDLDLLVEYQTNSRLHINIRPSHITATNLSWYLLSTDYVPAATIEGGSSTASDLTFSWSQPQGSGFGFNVTRNSTGEVLFSTTGRKLVFENQFIEIVANQDKNYNLYGLGEVIHALRLGNNFTRTIYAADVGDPIDRNLYGSHPFYLQTRYYEQGQHGQSTLVTEQLNTSTAKGKYTSSSNGVYFRNAHGMEVIMNETSVTWRTLGGVIDLYFFAGPTQPEVTKQYLSVIGMPAMQQYWPLGFHQCRWGYQNWTVTEGIVNSYEAFGIPLEVIWNDIDYMKQYRDFDNDPVRFGYQEGQAFLQRLHDSGRHYIPIVDAAIYHPNPDNASDAYQPYNDGIGSYLLNPDGSVYIGDVWPGYTVFVDWFAAGAHEYWSNQVVKYHSNLPIDGIWLDMSEVSSFCVGSCGSHNLSLNPVHPPFKLGGEPGNVIYSYPEGFNLTNSTAAASASSASSAQASSVSKTAAPTPSTTSYLRTTPTPGTRNINYPPYAINHVQNGADLAVHAVSPNATHANGIAEYDVHNLYGHHLIRATYNALLAVNSTARPVIIGRSTFPGSGSYAGHWGGDNSANYYYMYFSIPQALSFSLFGIPFFGVDTCGFNGNTDMELCNRWMQLSAFFPFYRNHNVISAIDQEAFRWASVIDATKTAMKVRFALLPYLYTLMWQAHTQGTTVMRALAWEFPDDPSLADADRQFFLGKSVLVVPVLEQGVSEVQGVLPGLVEGTEVYYDWYNQSAVPVAGGEKNRTIEAPLGHIPVFVRGGVVLACQGMRLTTRDARGTGWSVVVAPGVGGGSEGVVYLDDGVSIKPEQTKVVRFSGMGLTLNATVEGAFEGLDTVLGNVTFWGVKSRPQGLKAMLNGVAVGDATYNETSETVFVGGMNGVVAQKAWEKSWSLVVA